MKVSQVLCLLSMSWLATGCAAEPDERPAVDAPPSRVSPLPPPSSAVTNSDAVSYAEKRALRIDRMEEAGRIASDTIKFECSGNEQAGFYVRDFFDGELVRIRNHTTTDTSSRLVTEVYLDRGEVYLLRIYDVNSPSVHTRSYYDGDLVASSGAQIQPPFPVERLVALAAVGKSPCT